MSYQHPNSPSASDFDLDRAYARQEADNIAVRTEALKRLTKTYVGNARDQLTALMGEGLDEEKAKEFDDHLKELLNGFEDTLQAEINYAAKEFGYVPEEKNGVYA